MTRGLSEAEALDLDGEEQAVYNSGMKYLAIADIDGRTRTILGAKSEALALARLLHYRDTLYQSGIRFKHWNLRVVRAKKQPTEELPCLQHVGAVRSRPLPAVARPFWQR